MSLSEKLLKNSTVKQTEILENSKILNDTEMTSTKVPIINVALSGSLSGGLASGITVFAGKSKHFKSNFCLLLAESYLKEHKDSVVLFYDCEFGSPISYFKAMGIDPSRVIHTPIANVEQLKHDISVQVQNIERDDKVIIILDSLGNLASNKETEDALEGKNTVDMTRAKAFKSLFRIITAQLKIKNIPMLVIGHTYGTQEMYTKEIVGGGTGVYYGADNIYIVGRQQEKEGTEVVGYKFVLNVEKSRFIKEKSKIPVDVTFEGGINKFSGLIDLAIELGFVVKPKNGWYAKVDKETGETSDNYRLAQTENDEFWSDILSNPLFQQAVEDKYKYKNQKLLVESSETADVYEDDTEV